MIFKEITSSQIKHFIKTTKTSEKKKDYFLNKLNMIENNSSNKTYYSMALDDKYTIVTDGIRVGVAKRTTYPPKKDEENYSIGLTIALFRMLRS